jgi:hypothetical protein
MVIAPEHKLVQELKNSRTQEVKEINEYLENAKKKRVIFIFLRRSKH